MALNKFDLINHDLKALASQLSEGIKVQSIDEVYEFLMTQTFLTMPHLIDLSHTERTFRDLGWESFRPPPESIDLSQSDSDLFRKIGSQRF